MFRRDWCGLPKDVTFPSDLKSLGYFINEEDEIRSIDNPDFYFKFFLNRNARLNHRQRFAFDHAIEKIIHARLEAEGLQKTPLPLGTPPEEKHVPIFMDPELESKSRVVAIFGEVNKPLGLLAGRVANGHGGINKGSMVSVVKELKAQRSTAEDDTPPGIVLANVAQLYWWPDEKRALTVGGSSWIPLPTLVHSGRRYVKELNQIEQHETPEMHIQYLFDEVLAKKVGETAVIDVVSIGMTCELVESFLGQDKNWETWGHRLSSVLLMDTVHEMKELTNTGFKDFLAKRSRCYLRSPDPVDVPLAPPTGNESLYIAPLGMPCYSSSEPNYTECVLITALGPALSYLESNALYPEAENAIMTVVSKPRKGAEQEGEGQESRGLTDEAWGKLDDASKPSVEIIVPEMLGQLRGWKQYEETNVAPHPDCQDAAHSETKTASELEKTESAANDINPCNEQDKSGGRELAWR